jgi:hypothetical protein
MYASGDVENPDTDTIDYMEDLVVDWLAELVRRSSFVFGFELTSSARHLLPSALTLRHPLQPLD